MRIYPLFKWDDNNVYDIVDSYVECVFWNIKIPYKSILGDLYKSTGIGNSYDTTYFPGPDEPDFPGEKSSDTIWYYAGYGDNAGYITQTADDDGKFYNLRYTLTKNSNLGTSYQWKLKLKYETSAHEYENLATYVYNNGTKMWDLVSD